MNECDKISVLENGLSYDIVDTLVYNNIKYILFSNVDDIEDICVRKVIIKDNQEYFSLLDEIEFNDVMKKFAEKFKNLF